MAKVIMRVEGMDGQVELLSDRVVIYRKGIWGALKYGFNSRREIPLGAISEVVFKPAGINFGELEFVRSGRSLDERKNNAGSVHFGRKLNPQFEALKEKVFELLNQMNATRNK